MTLAPSISAFPIATSGAPYQIVWSGVTGANRYELQESATSDFADPTTTAHSSNAVTRQREVTATTSLYYRVRGISDCDPRPGPWSGAARVAIQTSLATEDGEAVAPFGTTDPLSFEVTLTVSPEDGATYTATSSESWLTIEQPTGTVPPDGRVRLRVTADPRALQVGTSTAAIHLRTATAAASLPVSVSLVTPVTPSPRPSASAESIIIPAVAHADSANARWRSDVRLAHTYPWTTRYALMFTPTGADALGVQQTTMTIPPGQTIALDDVLGRWFGVDAATGTLEIRALDAAPGTGRTIASSRLYNQTSAGSFGQFIPAVPLAQFIAGSSMPGIYQTLSLISLAQSQAYRTNLGIVEGGGHPATASVEVFGGDGTRLFETTVDLRPGEHRQLSGLLAQNGISTANARVDVRVLAGNGRVFGYASVVDNSTGDPSFVPPANSTTLRESRYTIAGVADVATTGGKWQTDLRLFNGGFGSIDANVEFYPQGSSTAAATRTIAIAPGEVQAVDDVLRSLFGIESTSGAIRITTASPAPLIPTARTYHRRDDGTYGQFVPGATDADAVTLGEEPLQILQVEESSRFRTNIGIAETSGRAATVEITASTPARRTAATLSVPLQPNEFRQMNALLRSMGLTDSFNGSVSVKVVEGEGRVVAYGSVVDNRTQDPTFVMAQ